MKNTNAPTGATHWWGSIQGQAKDRRAWGYPGMARDYAGRGAGVKGAGYAVSQRLIACAA